MESWNVEPTGITDEPYYFRNSSQTIISFSKRTSFDISILLVKMEERGVPFAYTEKLKELRFTILKGSIVGNYGKGLIHLSPQGWGPGSDESMCQTFIHELGHHIDEQEAISSDLKIIKEKKTCAKHLPDSYGTKNIDEYIAVGFEVFYFGSNKDKKKLRKKNKHLYKRIMQAHRKYRNRA